MNAAGRVKVFWLGFDQIGYADSVTDIRVAYRSATCIA